MALPATRLHSYDDYLAHERQSDTKHEYHDGLILAMAGGTRDHGLMAINAAVGIGSQLRGRPCRVYSSDVRVRMPDTGLATYPDLSVVCGPASPHPEDPDAVTNPTVLIEVLSESTERRDRGLKFAHYETLASLQHFVLIAHDRVRVEHFRRLDDGSWRWRSHGPGEQVELDAIDAILRVDEVYAQTELVAGQGASTAG